MGDNFLDNWTFILKNKNLEFSLGIQPFRSLDLLSDPRILATLSSSVIVRLGQCLSPPPFPGRKFTETGLWGAVVGVTLAQISNLSLAHRFSA